MVRHGFLDGCVNVVAGILKKTDRDRNRERKRVVAAAVAATAKPTPAPEAYAS